MKKIFALLTVAMLFVVGCDCHRRPAPVEVDLKREGHETHVKVGDTLPAAGVETPEARGKRLYVAHIRARVTRALAKEGFASVEGDAQPLDQTQIAKLHAAIDDDTIVASAVELEAVEVEQFPKLGGLLESIKARVKQIEALVKRLLGLMSLLK